MDSSSPHFWEDRYQKNQFSWDLGMPTPVFARLAANGQVPPGAMMVLGAGRGHDARLFARHGFAVTAVDFASAAINEMQAMDDPACPIEIIQSDFFSLPPNWNGRYQYILDYCSFCAILPERRSEYTALVARLLKPGGQFITLAFPIGTRTGGPPFTVQPENIIALFTTHGFTLRHREFPPDSVPERKKYEELLILQKNTVPE